MDDLDRAKELEMMQRKAAIEAVLNSQDRSVGEEPIEIDGVRYCLDCYDPIPQSRLEVKPDAIRCVHCKEIWEENNK